MFEVKIVDGHGEELDIAVDVRFAKDMVEVVVDESQSVLKKLVQGECFYIQIFGPKTMLGQSKLVEFEIEGSEINNVQRFRLNAIGK